jgi:hypothetical protein
VYLASVDPALSVVPHHINASEFWNLALEIAAVFALYTCELRAISVHSNVAKLPTLVGFASVHEGDSHAQTAVLLACNRTLSYQCALSGYR